VGVANDGDEYGTDTGRNPVMPGFTRDNMHKNAPILTRRFCAIMAFLWLILPADSSFATSALSVSVALDKRTYRPADTVVIAVQCRIAPGFHLYSNPLGPGIGIPLRISTEGSAEVQWLKALKSPPRKYQPGVDKWVWAYENTADFFICGMLPPHMPQEISGAVLIEGLVCRSACHTFVHRLPFTLRPDANGSGTSFQQQPQLAARYRSAEPIPLNEPRPTITAASRLTLPPPVWDYTPQEENGTFNIWLAIFFAFLAGVILNVMPCVLPVLGIKILSLSQGNTAAGRHTLLRSTVFSAGMLSVFLLLASLAAFAGFSWGQQFQKPGMLAAIIAFIVVFGLGLLDVYMIAIPARVVALPSAIAGMQKRNGIGIILAEFLKGVFTTLLATPCSGPFLGATLAWTLRQPPAVIYLVFCSLGLGMATPYVLLSTLTPLQRLIPRPGPWMEDFKHGLGFILFAFALYLMRGLPPEMIVPTISFCLVAAFAAAVYGRFVSFGAPLARKAAFAAVALLLAGFGWFFSFRGVEKIVVLPEQSQPAPQPPQWQDFDPQLLTSAHMDGRNVLVDFTARWCWNCQYNKLMVLNSKEVENLLQRKDVLLLKADFTNENPVAESLLRHLGSRSIPFTAIFAGDDPYRPLVIRDILDKEEMLKALRALPEKK
jgi:thiol:disulfide interchange protein DsbD